MHHGKAVSQRLLLQVPEACVWYVLQGAVPEQLAQRLVVDHNDQPSTKWRALSRASATARASPSMGAYRDSAAWNRPMSPSSPPGSRRSPGTGTGSVFGTASTRPRPCSSRLLSMSDGSCRKFGRLPGSGR